MRHLLPFRTLNAESQPIQYHQLGCVKTNIFRLSQVYFCLSLFSHHQHWLVKLCLYYDINMRVIRSDAPAGCLFWGPSKGSRLECPNLLLRTQSGNTVCTLELYPSKPNREELINLVYINNCDWLETVGCRYVTPCLSIFETPTTICFGKAAAKKKATSRQPKK